MDIAEIFLTLISPIIARMIFLHWIGDSDIAEEITGSLREIIAKFTSDKRTQRRTERELIDIGEEVAESLYKIFEIEGVDIESARKVVVAQAVADTLPNISADTVLNKLLLQFDLDAQSLSNYLLTKYPHKQSLDANEESLYQRIILETCERIIQVATSLPRFQAISFKELMKRNRVLTDIAFQTLARVNNLYEDAFLRQTDADMKIRRFEFEYRQAVATKLDRVELFGLEVRRQTNYRQPLSVAYVTLQVRHKILRINTPFSAPKALSSGHRIVIDGEPGSGKTTLLKWLAVRVANNDIAEVAPELEELSNKFPFFIRLRDFAKEEVPLPSPEKWPGLLAPHISSPPADWVHEQLREGNAIVLIDGLDEISISRRAHVYEWLTDLVSIYKKSIYIISSRPTALRDDKMEIWGQVFSVSNQNKEKFLQQWKRSKNELDDDQISQKKTILIELANELKSEIIEEVESLWGREFNITDKAIRSFRNSINLESSKSVPPELSETKIRNLVDALNTKLIEEAEEIWRRATPFFTLQRMSGETVDNFVANWHKAVAVAEGNAPAQHLLLENTANELKKQLIENAPLRQLATNPLLCAMICALHRDRKQQLPRDRITLYRSCLDALIEKRDIKRGVYWYGYPEFGQKQLHVILMDLSYWMLRNEYAAAAPKSEVTKRIAYRLDQILGVQDVKAEEILKLLIERIGLIREPVVNTIDFTHRSFQEYLAAEAIISEGDIRSLVPFLTNDEWHEVIVLTAGLANVQELSWLLRKLLAAHKHWPLAIDVQNKEKRRLGLLAIECLGTEPILNDDAKGAIQKHISNVRPPSSEHEAHLFSFAKDLAIPYLKYEPGDKDQEVYFTVKAISYIGVEKSQQQLLQISENISNNTQVELIASTVYKEWKTWDQPNEYLPGIYQPLVDESHYLLLLKAKNLISAARLLDLSRINHLELSDCQDVTDWNDFNQILWDMLHLSKLSLGRIRIQKNLELLTRLPRLRTLIIDEDAVLPENIISSAIRIIRR